MVPDVLCPCMSAANLLVAEASTRRFMVLSAGIQYGWRFFFGNFFLGWVPGFSSFLGTGGQGHGAGDAPRGCGVETRGPGLGSQPANASTNLYIYTYLCIYIYTHSYI